MIMMGTKWAQGRKKRRCLPLNPFPLVSMSNSVELVVTGCKMTVPPLKTTLSTPSYVLHNICLFYFCTNYFLIQTFLKRRCLCCLPWENTVIDTASLLASILCRRLNGMEDVTQASLARPHQRNHTTAHCLSPFSTSSDQLSGKIKRLFWQQTWCAHIKKRY